MEKTAVTSVISGVKEVEELLVSYSEVSKDHGLLIKVLNRMIACDPAVFVNAVKEFTNQKYHGWWYEIAEMVENNSIIKAIKHLRECTNMELKPAKEAIDAYRNKGIIPEVARNI